MGFGASCDDVLRYRAGPRSRAAGTFVPTSRCTAGGRIGAAYRGGVLSVTVDHVRVFLHIAAAGVWVGGQLTVVGLLTAIRSFGDEAPRQVARRFARLAWAAYAALVATGVWNLAEVQLDARTSEYSVTLMVKLGLVAASGLGAGLHAVARSRVGLAVWGAVGLLAGIAAMLLGVVLRG